MKAIKINLSLKQRILTSLKNNSVRAIDFPEFSDHTNEIPFTESEREFIKCLSESISERIYSRPRILNRYSKAIKLDKSIKVRLLKSLASGVITSKDLPELQHSAVDLSIAITREEKERLMEIVEKYMDC